MSARQYPLIGLTLDSEAPGGYSKFPWYAIRENYAGAVAAAGGVPLLLPHEIGLAAHYAGLLDGLIVTGGAFDVDPALYGAGDRHHSVTTKDKRTAFEMALAQAMLRADKAVLGICGGEQLLAVVLGGTLIQHIPDEIADPLAHEQPNPRDEPSHAVEIVADSLLYRLTGTTTLRVNSAHHQAVAAGSEFSINARAPDGVIEGIEDPRRHFCLGVQWHPEFEISAADRAIFAGFIAASARSPTS